MGKMSGGAVAKGGKRRNRAPPPPPGGKKGGGKLEGGREEGRERGRRGREEGRERREGEKERREEVKGESEGGKEGRQDKERRGERGEVAGEEDGDTRAEEGGEHDYSTILRSDYINWEYEQGSGSDSDDTSAVPGPRPHTARPSNPPTLPLNTHPVLMRSHSQGDVIDSNDESGKKPRNRAPPPPPSKTKSKPPRGFAHQLSHQPFSVPPPPSSSSQSHTQSSGNQGGEYARVTKPPPAYKRTKSDQKPGEDGDKGTGSPRERDRVPKSSIIGGASSSSPYQSPVASRKHGEAPVHLDVRAGGGGGKSSGYGSGGEGVTRGGGRVGEGVAPPSRPPPRAPSVAVLAAAGKRKRWSAAEVEGERRGREESPLLANLKRKESSGVPEHLSRPKRQAPPPPVGKGTAVDQSQDQSERESPQGAEAPSERPGSDIKTGNHLQTPPPKPKRLHRRTPPIPSDTVALATEATPTTQESTETEGRSQSTSAGTPLTENGNTRWDRLLHKMEFFTIDLVKDGDRSLGMVIVSGKVRNKDGSTVEGIFIQKILPGSLTDKDGRIQAGDMLVEINSVSMVGATVETASKKLRESRESVKLKVGRPDRGAFQVPGEDSAEPIYVNSDDIDDMEDSELQTRLEKTEARAKKMEELQEKAENDLKQIREMADKEQKSFHRKFEEAEAEKAAYQKDTQGKITDLTVALANITVDKTKLEKELETLRLSQTRSSGDQHGEELSRLKRELKEAESERDMAERHHKELRQEVEGGGGLQSRLAELESDLAQVREERETAQRQLESTCHELTVAHATLEQMQIEKRGVKEENERLSEEIERSRRPSAGRAGTEAELALKRKEVSSLQRELKSAREERGRVEREAGEARRELEKERGKIAELENKMESQQREEKTATSELLSRIETQEQQICDLKKELAEARVQGPAVATVAGAVKTAPVSVGEKEREREGEGWDSEKNKKLYGLSAGVKQRSLDIEPSIPEKRAQSPETSPRSRASSSANKDSPVKSGSPPKSPKPLRDKPHDDSFSIEAFDTIKPLEMLDNTLAKDKTQVALRNAKRVRNKPSREHIRSMSAENLLGGVEFPLPSSSSPTEKLPVPRPRKATLEKDSPVHKPLPIPRHLRSPVPPQNEATPPQRPPKPDSGPGSPDRKGRGTGRVSPPHTRAPSPKPLLPPTFSKSSGLPPKPAPRRPHRQGEDPAIEDTPTKDPSQLTIKERMELAHKAMKKPPPVLPKKPASNRPGVIEGDSGPKSLSQPDGDEVSEIPGTRYSDTTHSPRPVRRLPPGAVGLFPMAPFGVSPRHRSNTAAAGSSREQSQDREISDDRNTECGEDGTDSGSREALDLDDVEVKLLPKRPPLPLARRTTSNEKPAQLSSRNDDIPIESAPPPVGVAGDEGGEESEVKMHGEYGTIPDPTTLDHSQVLTWTPVQVAAWVTSIGVGQHAKGFLDKGLQGNKLFDIDSSDLKAMGVSSADDRTLIKREIKTLRQHADKQRKLLEKQRKDDKKKKKRQFV